MPAVDALPDDAIIQAFHVPYTRQREFVQTYRIARRLQMSHPIVNAGFRFRLVNRASRALSEPSSEASSAGRANCSCNAAGHKTLVYYFIGFAVLAAYYPLYLWRKAGDRKKEDLLRRTAGTPPAATAPVESATEGAAP